MTSSPPYPETARRPGWSALPVGLRAALADRLGAPVVGTRAATAGFTRGFAGVLTAADGGRVFVKAAPGNSHLTDWYAREAAILDQLPPDVPAPRPRWTLHEAGWFALGTDVVDGHPPRRPWDPAELATTLTAYADVAAALTDPPGDLAALRPPHLADLAREDILRWRDVAAGRAPDPALPARLERRVPDLVALESRLPEYVAGAPGLIHGDLRPDNVLLATDGRVWFCDWTWLCQGPAWFDLVTLLLGGYADGLDGVVPGAVGGLTAIVPGAVGGADGVVVGERPDGLVPGERSDGLVPGAVGELTAIVPGAVGGADGVVVGERSDGLVPGAGDRLDACFAAHAAAAGAPADALDVTLAALAGYFLTTASAVPSTATEQLAAHQRRSGEHALAWLARRQGWT